MKIENLQEIYYIQNVQNINQKIKFEIKQEQKLSFDDTIFVCCENNKISTQILEVLDHKPKKILFTLDYKHLNEILNNFLNSIDLNNLPTHFTLAQALNIP